MLLEDVMHHILQMHVKGISFREWRAGRDIDEQMRDEGFNVQVLFNKQNGFIYMEVTFTIVERGWIKWEVQNSQGIKEYPQRHVMELTSKSLLCYIQHCLS